MSLTFQGISLSGGLNASGTSDYLLYTANIYYPMQTIIGGLSAGASVSALTNYGTDGSTYNAISVPGRTQPTVYTVSGKKVLQLDGYTGNQWGYNISNAFTLSDASLFMVGWDAFGNDGAFASRCMGFGGQYGSPYQLCFFGWGHLNNASFLFRDTTDSGMSLSSYSSAGLQVFGIVKTGSTVVYYDNNTTPVTYPGSCGGTYGFNTVGYRDYGIQQPSTGYLGDVLYYNTALSNSDAGTVITLLKSLYGIS